MKLLGRVAAALVVLLPCSAMAEPIVGRATVIDGDTLDIRGQRFRLQGFDTPERAQICRDAAGKNYRCGQRASLALADKIGPRNVACEPIETDKYGRTVAVCRLGAEDLNPWIVAQCLGIACRQYSTAYVPPCLSGTRKPIEVERWVESPFDHVTAGQAVSG